jgi:hypothetical protein
MNWDTASRFSYNISNSNSSGIEWYLPGQSSFADFEGARRSIENPALDHSNWDGYDAFAIGKEAKDNALHALSWIERAAPVPTVTPNANGTISFEWENENGIGNLEIGRTRFSFYIRRSVGDPIFIDGIASQVYGIGPIVSTALYPKPLAPAYNNIVAAANV